MIKRIHPDPMRSREISPHIDRWWHIITKMPDLDEGNQKAQEMRVYASFFWGIVLGYISTYTLSNGDVVYKADKDALKLEENDLMVSNGTPCDKFFEVLDTIAIYPRLSDRILEKTDEKMRTELDDKTDVRSCAIFRAIDNAEFADPGIGPDSVPAHSFFTIPMMIKKSSFTDDYYEEDAINVLKASINEVRRYLEGFYDKNELSKAMYEILDVQFERFIADIELEKKLSENIYKETLFGRTISVIAESYDDISFHTRADEIRDKARKLRNA